MPWQECNQMDERVKFIAGLLDGEKMAVLCRRFGISRKTGYKILNRYNSYGLEGLTDRSRRPYRHANQLPIQIETLIVQSKQERPHWGAPKIRERLARLYPDVHTPAISHQGGLCLHCFRECIQGVRSAQRHPHRQRRSLRQSQRAVQPVKALSLVA
jgi:hypothetical protein